MQDRQQRLLATIRAVLQLAQKWPDVLSHPAVLTTLAELRSIHDTIAEHRSRELPWRFTTIRTAQIQAWCDVLREDHMMIVSSQASLHLVEPSSRKPLKLTVPHRRASPEALVVGAKAFDESVRPHLPDLIAKGVSADILDNMNEAVAELARWKSAAAPDQRREQKALHAEMAALIARGRLAIKLLGRQLASELRESPGFRTEFDSAVKTSVKPGPPKEKSSGETKRRKRPASHSIRAVPLSQYLRDLESGQ